MHRVQSLHLVKHPARRRPPEHCVDVREGQPDHRVGTAQPLVAELDVDKEEAEAVRRRLLGDRQARRSAAPLQLVQQAALGLVAQ